MAKRIAAFGLLVALACICGYIEFLLPLPFGVPGMKLGLANIVVVTALYTFGPTAAVCISLVRIFLNAFLFGSVTGMLYSLAGAVLSFVMMWLFYRNRHFSTVGVSMLGGIFHNIGQLLVAFAFFGVAGILYYAPLLLISGAVTGFLIGTLCRLLLPRLRKMWRMSV